MFPFQLPRMYPSEPYVPTHVPWRLVGLTTVTRLVAVWPAVSVAFAAMLYVPWSTALASQDADHPSVPFVSVPIGAPLTEKSTFVTPWSSVAFAVMATGPVTVAPLAGEVIDTVGSRSPVAPWTAWRALTSGSAIPSGSFPHWPSPTQSP